MEISLDESRTKLTQVYQFLKELYHQRNPVKTALEPDQWHLWLADLPDHEAIALCPLNEEASDSADQTGEIFRVGRPVLTEAPMPPAEIKDWITGEWQRIDAQVKPLAVQYNSEKEDHSIAFEDDAERIEAFTRWMEAREAWVKRERPARETMDIYDRLYQLHDQLEKSTEQLDLWLGDGILQWHRPDNLSIDHPLLLQRVQLHFEPSIPEFVVRFTDDLPELYTPIFSILPDVRPSAVGELIQDLTTQGYQPLGDENTAHFLHRVVTQLSSQGQYYDYPVAKTGSEYPIIVRHPVLFVRKSTRGFSQALDKILEDLANCEHIPEAILNIVGIETATQGPSEPGFFENIDVNGDDERILFSKEANHEQLEIALRLEQYGAVLVQGPPGTGKTHTIANLLGHLIAQGKTVLVTSHTEKALRVLRDKVVDALQPLCVNVSTDSLETRQQMDQAIDYIADRVATVHEETLDKEAALLTQHRSQLLNEIWRLRQELKHARHDEYRPIVVAGQPFHPTEAASFVRKYQMQHDWIPHPVMPKEPLPLSLPELVELYGTNEHLTDDMEREMQMALMDPKQLMSPVEFEELVQRYNSLQDEDSTLSVYLWREGPHDIEILQHLLDRIPQILKPLQCDPWNMDIIAAGMGNDGLKHGWEEFIAEIVESHAIHRSFMIHDVKITSTLSLDQALMVVEEIRDHLRHGGKLGSLTLFMKPKWKQLIQNTRINNGLPTLSEHFDYLHDWCQWQLARENLRRRWQRLISEHGGPGSEVLGDRPEEMAYQFVPIIRNSLHWYEKQWLPFKQELERQGLDVDTLIAEGAVVFDADHVELARLHQMLSNDLAPIITSIIRHLRWQQTVAQLDRLNESLKAAWDLSPNSNVINNLYQAAIHHDYRAYRQYFIELTRLHDTRSLLSKRQEYLKRLETVAPNWAHAISRRQGVHGSSTVPGDAHQAWIWRQLADELDRRASTSIDALQTQIEERSIELRQITAQLIEKKSWSAQAKRTTLAQRQALMGWKQLMKKIGKGTGIRAPRLREAARKLMVTAQNAVPVWIMPVARVVENFVPGRNRFDVVIIDEASQADIMALTVLYLGNKVLVVGDDEQVSPDDVGRKLIDTQRLIDTYLSGIPNAALYDGKSSIYDLVKTSFTAVQLREHFRCVTPIIQFSNHLAYGGSIRPLRDDSRVRRKPATIAHFVDGAKARGKVNEKEALTVASLLAASLEHPAYEDATFGVISLKGDDQAKYIETLLHQFIPATKYQQHKIRCGSSAQFQGDERDVMFLSIVYAPHGDGPLRLLPDPQNQMRKRFNVAASRARDQMWVVHSVDPYTDLKEDDLRKRLILYARDPQSFEAQREEQQKRVESEFENQVLMRLLDAGYRVRTQWPVGSYRIDMVVEGGGKRLAIECDGERWHPVEKIEEDMARQAILERLGWRFIRIRGSQFFRDPDETMRWVFEQLHRFRIAKEGLDNPVQGKQGSLASEDDCVDWIKRRAAELCYRYQEDYGLPRLAENEDDSLLTDFR